MEKRTAKNVMSILTSNAKNLADLQLKNSKTEYEIMYFVDNHALYDSDRAVKARIDKFLDSFVDKVESTPKPMKFDAFAASEKGATKGSSRFFEPISLEDFKLKVQKLFDENGEYEFPYSMPKTIEKDISKVNFDFENYEIGVKVIHGKSGDKCLGFEDVPGTGYMNYPTGFIILPNNMPAFFVNAGGDWESPICFVIYWDGKQLRGYIPKAGNFWNRKTKSAFGNNEESDYDRANLKSLLEEAKAWMSPDKYIEANKYLDSLVDIPEEMDFAEFEDYDLTSTEAIFKDVQARILKKESLSQQAKKTSPSNARVLTETELSFIEDKEPKLGKLFKTMLLKSEVPFTQNQLEVWEEFIEERFDNYEEDDKNAKILMSDPKLCYEVVYREDWDETGVYICPKPFWDKEKHAYDSTILPEQYIQNKELSRKLSDTMEGYWQYKGGIDTLRALLKKEPLLVEVTSILNGKYV
jgi:hypothetical protein